MTALWVDKYHPRSLKEYVWEDDGVETMVESWLKNGVTDNILLSGPPGVGKTTLARLLIGELGISQEDTLFLNASRDNNIEVMRTIVQEFISVAGWSGMKYIILDEADGLSRAAQNSMKSDMESYSSDVRWILTSNTAGNIIEPIRDRCCQIDISKPNMDRFQERMVEILTLENIEIDDDSITALDDIIKKSYPSLRLCVRNLQNSCLNGVLRKVNETNGSSYENILDLFVSGSNTLDARKSLCESISKDQIVDVYRWLYKNSNRFADEEAAIVLIAEGVYRHSISADPEINLSSTLISLKDCV